MDPLEKGNIVKLLLKKKKMCTKGENEFSELKIEEGFLANVTGLC